MTASSEAPRPGFRREEDLLGHREVPEHALWGIHTLRAHENFDLARRPVHRALVHAYGAVKLACIRTNHELGRWDGRTLAALEAAAREMMAGSLDDHVVVDALQGGAGTSTNMNVNEVLTNRALVLLGLAPGSYEVLHPLDDLNLHQSTNDTYPTALRVAAIGLLADLETALDRLVTALQEKERAWADVVKVGRTQLQDAVLVTLGREAGAWAEALSRDRWRISKCVERLRVVNLGGTAVGTSLGAPRRYVFRVVETLRSVTGLGLARAENLLEATQNADAFVEVSGLLKTLATNQVKICSDLRLLASGPEAGLGELHLPARQAGSSIMPGKVNPVIPEAVIQGAITAVAADAAISWACALGQLELNAFLPLVADRLLDAIDVLTRACVMLRVGCVEGMEADRERCRARAGGTVATATALAGRLGHGALERLAARARTAGEPLLDLIRRESGLSADEVADLTAPDHALRLGSPDEED